MRPDRIPAIVLGATGAVGQRLVSLLADHPWFDVTAVAASETSAGRPYAEACHWILPGTPTVRIARMTVDRLDPDAIDSPRPAVVFSALPAGVAREVEPRFAEAGYAVCSNASAYREAPDVPLVIPEVNTDHLGLLDLQRSSRGWAGLLVTNPNCSTIGIVLAVKALDEAFGLRRVSIVTLQAISGAGYPGVASLDILGNVVRFSRQVQGMGPSPCLEIREPLQNTMSIVRRGYGHIRVEVLPRPWQATPARSPASPGSAWHPAEAPRYGRSPGPWWKR